MDYLWFFILCYTFLLWLWLRVPCGLVHFWINMKLPFQLIFSSLLPHNNKLIPSAAEVAHGTPKNQTCLIWGSPDEGGSWLHTAASLETGESSLFGSRDQQSLVLLVVGWGLAAWLVQCLSWLGLTPQQPVCCSGHSNCGRCTQGLHTPCDISVDCRLNSQVFTGVFQGPWCGMGQWSLQTQKWWRHCVKNSSWWSHWYGIFGRLVKVLITMQERFKDTNTIIFHKMYCHFKWIRFRKLYTHDERVNKSKVSYQRIHL